MLTIWYPALSIGQSCQFQADRIVKRMCHRR